MRTVEMLTITVEKERLRVKGINIGEELNYRYSKWTVNRVYTDENNVTLVELTRPINKSHEQLLEEEQQWIKKYGHYEDYKEDKRFIFDTDIGLALYFQLDDFDPRPEYKYTIAKLMLENGIRMKRSPRLLQKAIDLFHTLLDFPFNRMDLVHYYLGLSYSHQRDFELSLHYLTLALQSSNLYFKQRIRALLATAQCYAHMKKYDEAMHAIESAEQVDTYNDMRPEIVSIRNSTEMVFQNDPFEIISQKGRVRADQRDLNKIIFQEEGTYVLVDCTKHSIKFTGPKDTVIIPAQEAKLLRYLLFYSPNSQSRFLSKKIWPDTPYNPSNTNIKTLKSRLCKTIARCFYEDMEEVIVTSNKNYIWNNPLPWYIAHHIEDIDYDDYLLP